VRFSKSLSSLMLMALLAVVARSAHAQSPAEPAAASGEITVTGCVKKGVEAGCWALMDEHGNAYSFTGAVAAPDQCYRVTGSQAMGFCMQGTQLEATKIEASEANCCHEK
jgi:hypothetical protein